MEVICHLLIIRMSQSQNAVVYQFGNTGLHLISEVDCCGAKGCGQDGHSQGTAATL